MYIYIIHSQYIYIYSHIFYMNAYIERKKGYSGNKE